ncbi:MAG: AAA family ATPase [Deltaproteobacteria bacterium]|nr:AAA family ATPase [Deltaproteobacteria bacterium]
MPRPLKTFAGFIGQDPLVRHLKRLADGSKARGLPLPALMFTGPAGVGKTSLANSLSAYYGTTLVARSAAAITPTELARLVLGLSHADVFFVDEAHALPAATESALLALNDDLKVAVTEEKQVVLKSVVEHTLILATNRPGEVSKALRSRCHPFMFAEYTERELVEIARNIAREKQLDVTTQALGMLAHHSEGRPRGVARTIEAIARFCSGNTITRADAADFLRSTGLDEQGLTRAQSLYIGFLRKTPTRRMSVERLAALLGLDAAYLVDEIEPSLLSRGFIDITASGRTLLQDPAAQPQTIPTDGGNDDVDDDGT